MDGGLPFQHDEKPLAEMTGAVAGASAAELPQAKVEGLRGFLLNATTDAHSPAIADVARKAEMSDCL